MTSTIDQESIRAALGVPAEFDVKRDAERRIAFLTHYLAASGASGYVLGISGGVDSTVAGRLARLACERVDASFTAMRLPYGEQADESEAIQAIDFIDPTSTVTVDIKPAVDA
ncbi:MAG TPA: NAD(+) synthase, partial [Nocardioides sp.]|nr:NAD(+) synthase [Nocardioides sp.]